MHDCLSLGVRAPGDPALFSLQPPPPADGSVALRTLYARCAGSDPGRVPGSDGPDLRQTACCQGGAPELRLGEEFHHNGLTIRCAQIARVPRGLARSWDRRRLAEETARLLTARGDDLRRHLIAPVVPIEDGPQVLLALARRELSTRQLIFVFTPPS